MQWPKLDWEACPADVIFTYFLHYTNQKSAGRVDHHTDRDAATICARKESNAREKGVEFTKIWIAGLLKPA